MAAGNSRAAWAKTSKFTCHKFRVRIKMTLVHWEPTDQFGNLYIGTCQAFDIEDLRAPLTSMLVELRERATGDIRLTIDLEYSEINGPDPEQVSHILRTSWLETQIEAGKAPEHILESVNDLVLQLAESSGANGVLVRLA